MKASTLESDRPRWKRIEEVFHRAEELPEEEREAFLAAACDGDEALRSRVLALLAAEIDAVDSVGGILAGPGAPGDVFEEEEAQPERVGRYKILRTLGRGGLSSVFLAERADGTFRKHVALKLVRRGLDTRDILGRLRQERQILARLDHPNISRLLDGGSSEDGRPYFVMEYIEGVPIDEYCHRQQASLHERLELIRAVCGAVQFAHQNLTIHRDIKPSNILVTEDGTPKLLDFGIAKVLESDGGQTTWQATRAGIRFMTPAYASPEQIRGEVLSTATDVYSLGVLLFRLLSGAAPYDLDGLPFHRLESLVCEDLPPRLSQRLSPESMLSVGWSGISAARLKSRLRGDLDTIVSVALRKEPERRYGSAEQLAEDLRRHLRALPVRAQPDQWTYRAGKFVGRHWRGLVAASLMLLTLAAVVGYFSYQLVEERDRAVRAFARAEVESSKAVRVTDFLQQIFEISNPSRSLGESVTAVQLLNRGAAQIEDGLAEESEIQASLMEAISRSYEGLGLFAEAGVLLERSFQLRQELFDPPHPALASSHDRLGELRNSQGRYEEAETHLREALRQRRLVFGSEDPKVAESEGSLGAIAHNRGRLDEAEEWYRKALKQLRLNPGPRGKETLLVQSNLVALLYNRGSFSEAAALGREVLAVQQEELGRNHPDAINTEATLAALQLAAPRSEQAEPLLRQLWERQRELLGDRHPDVALAANNLAAALFHLGRYEEAEPLYRQALEVQTAVLGRRHLRTAATMLNLADLEAKGFQDYRAARDLYQEGLAMRRSLVGAGSRELLNPLLNLGRLELGQGNPALAVRWFQEAEQILSADLDGPDPQMEPWRCAEARSLLGEALSRQGDVTRGTKLAQGALSVLLEELGEDDPKTQAAIRRGRELDRFLRQRAVGSEAAAAQ